LLRPSRSCRPQSPRAKSPAPPRESSPPPAEVKTIRDHSSASLMLVMQAPSKKSSGKSKKVEQVVPDVSALPFPFPSSATFLRLCMCQPSSTLGSPQRPPQVPMWMSATWQRCTGLASQLPSTFCKLLLQSSCRMLFS
jgi:hypothetical protein